MHPVRINTISSTHSPELELRVVGDASSVLFVHGACSQAVVWEPLMLALLADNVATAAISLRGHGRSSGAEHLQQYRIQDYVDDVLQVLPSLVQPVTLIGHSMGGLVCQLVAARTDLRQLILIAPCPIKGMRRDGFRMVCRHPYTFLAAWLRRSFLRLYRSPRVRRSLLYHAGTPDNVISHAATTLVEESWQAGNQMNTLLADPQLIHCPVTVLAATEDFMVSPASMKATALAYNVDPVFLPASGHMIQSEVPAPKLAAVLRPLLIS